jgi:hypothetical protein
MKKLIATVFLVFMFSQIVLAQEIKEQEKLTLNEQKILYYAKEKVAIAEQELKAVESQIAKDHKMQNQDFIGWKQYYKIEYGNITLYLERVDFQTWIKKEK